MSGCAFSTACLHCPLFDCVSSFRGRETTEESSGCCLDFCFVTPALAEPPRIEPGLVVCKKTVSDFKLEEPTCFKDDHPYLRNKSSSCVHPLGDYLENYVTFDSRTYVAPGDWIYLYDSADKLIGAYTGYELSGKTVTVRTNALKVVLESNDDNQQGWGYSINKVEHIPYEVLYPLLNDVRKKKK